MRERKIVDPHPPARKKKRGARLLLAYAVRALAALLAAAAVVLLICGVLYIREHLFSPPGGGPAGGLSGEVPASGTSSGGDAALPAPPDPARLSGTVVLDAGHGGADGGCEFDGVQEKDIALDIVLLAKEKLEARGITVVLTRDADVRVSLDERCAAANGSGADLFVSVHCNSFEEDPSVSGFEGYFHDSAEGEQLAESILRAAAALGIETRSVRDENYQVLRETAMPAALIEVGFLTNSGERAKLQTAEYRETVAQAVADGAVEMLEALKDKQSGGA